MKITIFDLRPNIYKVGIWKELNKMGDVCKVYFLSDQGVFRTSFDQGFGIERKSDAWLLEDLEHEFIVSNSFYKYWKIFRVLFKERSNVVLLQGYNRLDYLFIFLLTVLLGVPLLFRGEGTLKEDSKVAFLLKSIMIRLIGFKAKKVLYSCNGNFTYFKHYGVRAEKLLPLTCAVDNKFYQQNLLPLSDIFGLRHKLGIHKDDFVVGFVGRFDQRKCPNELIEAIDILPSKMKRQVTLLFLGGGSLEKNLKDDCYNKSIKAVFAGFIEQRKISHYYSLMDLFVLTSRYDNSPKVLNEALACGVPSIATVVCGQAEELLNGISIGGVYKPGDVERLTSLINDAMGCQISLDQRRASAFDLVSEATFDVNARQILCAAGMKV